MRKSILYLITQSEMGGAQAYVFDLAKNFKQEFKVSVAFGEQGEKGDMAKKFKDENIEYFVIPYLKRSISPINDLIALIEIRKLIKKINPDIIHLNSSKISILGSLAVKLIVKSQLSKVNCQKSIVIYTAHGWVFNEPMPVWKKAFYKYAEKITAKFKNKIICVSEFDRQIALKEKIAPEKKLITIHNGIKSFALIDRKSAIEEILKSGDWSFEIKEDDLIIGSIGNLYKTKGFEYLVEATKKLKSEKIKIIIMGKTGEERKRLNDLINTYELKNKILLSRPKKPSRLLGALDVYVCSSVKEGLSYTIIEAMQAGLPIIATKVGGNPEMIKDNETGLLIDSKNPEQITETVMKIINNKDLGEKLGNRAKQVAEAEFTLDKMIAETKEIYK